jgi:hypothetical protein
MPLYRRTSAASSLNGFPSLGSKGSTACSGQFVFSNSPNQTGANQFLYMVCENNTEGNGFSGYSNTTGYLFVNLENTYLTQGWFIKNNIIAIGENRDGTQSEYFNTELNAFVFSEGYNDYNIIQSSSSLLAQTRPEFNAQIFSTESGIKYEFVDSNTTKMKWTSKIEVIQNINKEKIEFSTQQIQNTLLGGTFPQNSLFNSDSKIYVNLDGGIDQDLQSNNNVDAGTDTG